MILRSASFRFLIKSAEAPPILFLSILEHSSEANYIIIVPIHNLYLGIAKHLFQNKKINSIKALFDVYLTFADFINQ